MSTQLELAETIQRFITDEVPGCYVTVEEREDCVAVEVHTLARNKSFSIALIKVKERADVGEQWFSASDPAFPDNLLSAVRKYIAKRLDIWKCAVVA